MQRLKTTNRRRWLPWLTCALAAVGLWQLGSGLYIHAKAYLAQVLLRSAWERSLQGEARAKPWPWADTWPVARLRAPRHGIDLFVLAGASGRTLAFGPGHLPGTPLPGKPGNSVLSAHRDTHFSFLQRLAAGDELTVETADGKRYRYQVSERFIFNALDTRIVIDTPLPRLTLVTCYPFDALAPGGPLRYAVSALPM